MDVYNIKSVVCDDSYCSVMGERTEKKSIVFGNAKLSGTLRVSKMVMLPKKTFKNLRGGQKFFVLQDNILNIEDYAYVYRGGMVFHTKPASYDKYSCKCYLKSLPGIFSSGKLDRAVFKIAIARECCNRGLIPSLVAWRNLRNVWLWDAYSYLIR